MLFFPSMFVDFIERHLIVAKVVFALLRHAAVTATAAFRPVTATQVDSDVSHGVTFRPLHPCLSCASVRVETPIGHENLTVIVAGFASSSATSMLTSADQFATPMPPCRV